MKNKEIITIIIAFIIFTILVFTTPYLDSRYSSLIWMLFFLCILLLIIIWLVLKFKNMPKEQIINSYKKQHKILKILEILIVISLIYETVASQGYSVTVILVGISVLYEIFLKKEN